MMAVVAAVVVVAIRWRRCARQTDLYGEGVKGETGRRGRRQAGTGMDGSLCVVCARV